MGIIVNFFTFTFRTLFVLSLLGLAVKQFTQIENSLPNIKTGLNKLEKNIPANPHVANAFEKLNQIHFELLHIHIGLLIFAALSCLFRMRISKVAMFLYVFIELAINNNYFLERTEKNLTNVLMYTTIMSSVFYC